MYHCSTIEERIGMISQLLAQPGHGLVSELSRVHQVSRQTLYRWLATGRQALQRALGKPSAPIQPEMLVPQLVLSLLIETHASYRGIQSILRSQHGIKISLGKISNLVQEAGQRAQRWMQQQRAETARALALDEQYSSQRGKAYLNVIDVHSGQVWASVPPVQVDGESWTLVLWYLSEQGISRLSTASDGGRAIADGVSQVQAETQHQRAIWHLFHVAAQVQGRLDRARQIEADRLPALRRQAERLAAGKQALGRPSQVSVGQQEALIARLDYVAQSVRYLCQELRHLLEVVVLRSGHLLSSRQRQEELQTVLDLLEELIPQAGVDGQKQLQMLCKQLRLALFQTLLFARQLDDRQ